MKRLCLVAILASLWVGSASAGVLDNLPWVIAEKAAAAGTATVAAATGVPTASTPFRVLANYQTVAPFILSNDVSGDVIASAGGTLKTPVGDKAVQVVGHMPKASVAAAIGRAAGKVVPFVGTGYALYDLAQELGLLARKGADGSIELLEDGTVTEYRFTSDLPWSTSLGGAASAYLALQTQINHAQGGTATYFQDSLSLAVFYYHSCYENPYLAGDYVCQAANAASIGPVISRVVPGDPIPVTDQAFVDKVAAKSGWPSGSQLAAAAAAAIAAGEVIDVIPKTITGPADSGDSVETGRTTDSAAGTRTVTKERQQFKYNPSPWPYSQTSGSPSPSPGTMTPTGTQPAPQTEVGPSVSITNITTTTVINTQTGDTINTTETVKTPVPPPETVVNPASPPPEDPCLKNPDRAGCVNLGTPPPAEKLPEKKTPVVVTPIPFAGGGGSCPAPLTLNVFGAAHEISYQPICDQLSILRALMLAIAGLMAAYILADSFKVT